MRTPALTAIVALGYALGAPGCAADKKYSPTALQAVQTREFNAGLDPAFDATVGSLFDLGYAVNQSDKRAGFVSASRMAPPSVWAAPRSLMVQAKLDALGPARTSVRLNTIIDGQTRVDEKIIGEVFDRMAAYHLGAPPPATGRKP